jgi:hypothetical protein
MNTGFSRRPDRVWVVAAVVAAVVLAVGGVSLAVRGVPGRATAAPASAPASAGRVPAASAPAASGSPAPATRLVRLGAGAAGNPSAGAVVQLRDRHFSAINDGDYDRWRTTVVPRRAADQSRASWRRAFRSTVDESVEVDGLTSTSSGIAAEITFVSRQDPADAPARPARRPDLLGLHVAARGHRGRPADRHPRPGRDEQARVLIDRRLP